MMKWLVKYWAQVTGLITLLGLLFIWCWRLAVRFDELVSKVNQAQAQLLVHSQQLDQHDELLDDHDRRIMITEKLEELREKGLMK